MSCEIFWTDNVINRRFNHFYPVMVSTPNGQTVSSVRVVNLEKNEETGALEEISLDRDDQPCVLVKGYDEDLNEKRKSLAPHESKYYVSLSTSKRKQVMVGPNGEKESITHPELLDSLDFNEEGRLFSTFVIVVARTQAPAARYLYQMNMDITMSDGTELSHTFKYLVSSPKIYKMHKAALNQALYIFYHNLMDNNLTDNEIMGNVNGRLTEIWPDLGSSIKMAKKVAASNGTERRAYLDSKKVAPENDRRRTKRSFNQVNMLEDAVELHAGDDDLVAVSDPPAKRQLTEATATVMGSIEWLSVDNGMQYIFLHGLDVSGDEWSIDNVEVSPVIDGKVEISKEPPVSLNDNPDMYKGLSYRKIIENARTKAASANESILWFKISDNLELMGPDHPCVIKFTVRNSTTGQYVNVTTNGFESSTMFSVERTVIAALYKYFNGQATGEYLLNPVEPEAGDADFVHFHKPGDLDLGGLSDDLEDVEDAPMPPPMDRQDSFFDESLMGGMDDLVNPPPAAPQQVRTPSPQPLSPAQLSPDSFAPPPFEPTPSLDFELEPLDFDN